MIHSKRKPRQISKSIWLAIAIILTLSSSSVFANQTNRLENLQKTNVEQLNNQTQLREKTSKYALKKTHDRYRNIRHVDKKHFTLQEIKKRSKKRETYSIPKALKNLQSA